MNLKDVFLNRIYLIDLLHFSTVFHEAHNVNNKKIVASNNIYHPPVIHINVNVKPKTNENKRTRQKRNN